MVNMSPLGSKKLAGAATAAPCPLKGPLEERPREGHPGHDPLQKLGHLVVPALLCVLQRRPPAGVLRGERLAAVRSEPSDHFKPALEGGILERRPPAVVRVGEQPAAFRRGEPPHHVELALAGGVLERRHAEVVRLGEHMVGPVLHTGYPSQRRWAPDRFRKIARMGTHE